jgi:hypothetical protein
MNRFSSLLEEEDNNPFKKQQDIRQHELKQYKKSEPNSVREIKLSL